MISPLLASTRKCADQLIERRRTLPLFSHVHTEEGKTPENPASPVASHTRPRPKRKPADDCTARIGLR